jgi:hypothetical protein
VRTDPEAGQLVITNNVLAADLGIDSQIVEFRAKE